MLAKVQMLQKQNKTKKHCWKFFYAKKLTQLQSLLVPLSVEIKWDQTSLLDKSDHTWVLFSHLLTILLIHAASLNVMYTANIVTSRACRRNVLFSALAHSMHSRHSSTSCPVAASISRKRSNRERTSRAAFALLMEIRKGLTNFRSPPSSGKIKYNIIVIYDMIWNKGSWCQLWLYQYDMRSTDTSLKHWNGIRSDATLFISDLLKYFIEKHISTDNTGLDNLS